MENSLLEKINSPSDLKLLSQKEINTLCREIRDFLIDVSSKNGGHLASNLGVTELSVALHRVFDSPSDHIIFDVGHQSYVHKLLTGRKDKFSTLRTVGGLSGFTKMSESVHDAFGAGHSSTSVSAALGYAEADRLKGSNAYSIAVLGDGAYTGGMIHEALNNADPELKLIIILNENGMSISVNKGTFARYLTDVRVSKGYNDWKKNAKSILSHIPILGKAINLTLGFFKQTFKSLFFSSNYFEDLGLYYIGPIDGNDYEKVEKTLHKAKNLGKCVVVHIKTTKGKGYEPAEKEPEGYHSVSVHSESSFHSEFVKELISRAEQNNNIVAITPAMGKGTGFEEFGRRFSNRYYDVGIAEEHAVTFCAGLAAAGMTPFVGIYSTFLQRAYDSVLHDAALQNLPVRLIIDRAGIAVRDGATHHGIFDVSLLSNIPGVTIVSPASYSALRSALDFSLNSEGVVAIRYPNDCEDENVKSEFYSKENRSLSLKTNFSAENAPDKVFVTYGTIARSVLKAEKMIRTQGGNVGTILLEILKPYDFVAKVALPYLKSAKNIVFVEEGIKNGGAGMLFFDALKNLGFDFKTARYEILAIDDNFASPEYPCDIYDYLGLTPQKIMEKMK